VCNFYLRCTSFKESVETMSLPEKIRSFFKRGPKNEKSASFLAGKYSQQQAFADKRFGTEGRKRSFFEKWRTKKEKQDRKNGEAGFTPEKQKRSSFKAVILAGIVVSGAYFLVTGPMQSLYGNFQYFRIHEIEISGCVMTDPVSLRKFADISYEMNMLTIDSEAMQQRLEKHPWVARATVRRIWPDGLMVGVTEYRPQALVLQEGADGFNYFDKKGNVFAKVSSGQEIDLPVITGLDAFDTDTEKKELLATAAEFLRLAGRNNPNLPAQNVSEIHFSNDGELILYLVEHPFPIYLGKGEVKRKYYQLRKVLEVLYRKKKGRAMIEQVAYIRMDYQENKVLVAKRHAG